MNFLITINESYVQHIKALLFSIYYNLGEGQKIYFIYSDLSIESRNWLSEYISQDLKSYAIFVKFPYLDKIKIFENVGSWTRETFFRLYAPYLLPSSVNYILYLDGDTIVNSGLPLIFQISKDHSFPIAGTMNDKQIEHKSRLNLSSKEFYINAGVILIDCFFWREHLTLNEMNQKLFNLKDDLLFRDQDFINLIWRGRIKILPKSYNYMISVTEKDSTYQTIKNPDIVHYVMTKPWVDWFEYKTDSLYLHYLWLSGGGKEAARLWNKHRILQTKNKIKDIFKK